jgi:hypothetical protein
MKKVLFLGLILAILLFAFPQGVTAAVTGDVTVDATIAESIDFTPSTEAVSWDLSFVAPNGPINVKDPAVSFGIVSNRPWKITVTDADTDTAGHLTPYDGSGYSGIELYNPLIVGTINMEGGTGGTILSDVKGTYTKTTSFTQTLIDTDAAGPTYRIVLTFDIMDNGA